MDSDRSSTAEAFKALGDPVRWSIVQSMAKEPELAGSVLDEALSISRPTISYHIRILTQAGLVDVSKRGRNHFYTLRHEVLRSLIEDIGALMPLLEHGSDPDTSPHAPPATSSGAGDAERPAVLPTW